MSKWFNPNCLLWSRPEPSATPAAIREEAQACTPSISRSSRIRRSREKLRLQFRAEFFNITNHQNLALPVSTVFTTSSSTFGAQHHPLRNQFVGRNHYEHRGHGTPDPVRTETVVLFPRPGAAGLSGKPRRSQAWAPC